MESLHELFPRIACDSISKKLSQWVINKQRGSTVRKRARIRELHVDPIDGTFEYQDYEELLEVHNVSMQNAEEKTSNTPLTSTQKFEEYDVGN